MLADLAATPPSPGWFTKAFCEDARYFTPENGARIDAMRDRIEVMGLEPELKAIALVALMEAADRVDSTAGLQMAYMKQWATRALKPLELRMPACCILPSPPVRAARPRPMRWRRPPPSTATSSISTRPTTSIPTSGTTMSGKAWCCGTGPRPMASPTSGST